MRADVGPVVGTDLAWFAIAGSIKADAATIAIVHASGRANTSSATAGRVVGDKGRLAKNGGAPQGSGAARTIGQTLCVAHRFDTSGHIGTIGVNSSTASLSARAGVAVTRVDQAFHRDVI